MAAGRPNRARSSRPFVCPICQGAPIDDVRSTAEYRRFALERVVRRQIRGGRRQNGMHA